MPAELDSFLYKVLSLNKSSELTRKESGILTTAGGVILGETTLGGITTFIFDLLAGMGLNLMSNSFCAYPFKDSAITITKNITFFI